MSNQTETPVYSYWDHRTVVGILGVSLPFVLLLGGLIFGPHGLQDSLSSYYYTRMRDVFVGTLWAIGFFMLSYRGYARSDGIAGNLACLFAVLVSLFPTEPAPPVTTEALYIGYAHLVFAALFFLTLSYFCIFLFTKTDPAQPPTTGKLLRNRIYRACGYVMLFCILFMGVDAFFPGSGNTYFHPLFWLETAAILAFGVAWFAKGRDIQNIFPSLR